MNTTLTPIPAHRSLREVREDAKGLALGSGAFAVHQRLREQSVKDGEVLFVQRQPRLCAVFAFDADTKSAAGVIEGSEIINVKFGRHVIGLS